MVSPGCFIYFFFFKTRKIVTSRTCGTATSYKPASEVKVLLDTLDTHPCNMSNTNQTLQLQL